MMSRTLEIGPGENNPDPSVKDHENDSRSKGISPRGIA